MPFRNFQITVNKEIECLFVKYIKGIHIAISSEHYSMRYPDAWFLNSAVQSAFVVRMSTGTASFGEELQKEVHLMQEK